MTIVIKVVRLVYYFFNLMYVMYTYNISSALVRS
nr:MAG TPA: hypothetical protein [Caudoviricetes sp.]